MIAGIAGGAGAGVLILVLVAVLVLRRSRKSGKFVQAPIFVSERDEGVSFYANPAYIGSAAVAAAGGGAPKPPVAAVYSVPNFVPCHHQQHHHHHQQQDEPEYSFAGAGNIVSGEAPVYADMSGKYGRVQEEAPVASMELYDEPFHMPPESLYALASAGNRRTPRLDEVDV